MAFNPLEKAMKKHEGQRKKKIMSGGAYTVLKDDARLIEGCVDEAYDIISSRKIKSGVYLNQDCEDLPVFGPKAPIEKVISRVNEGTKQSGARIVLTKDNYGNRTTGVGGAGGTMCEAIDIVAGTLSCEARIKTSKTETRANFISDGARIYLTERGDIQHYFAVGDGSSATSITSKMKSGIGIKADHTMIIGRERIRILVGMSKAHGVERLVNYNNRVTPKIEIAQIGDDNAQPAVLGYNLEKYLKKQNEEVQALRNRVQDLENNLVQYKAAMALHGHMGGGLGVVTVAPSPGAASEGIQSIPEFFQTTMGNILETYRSTMRDMRSMGTERKILVGSKNARLLSTTVYIGM